jgi:cysteine sulfinate desulfinase/cysteine desulfurase-like protein
VFTSGGSESNNMAIKGVVWKHGSRGSHIITTAIEHPAVSEVCYHLEKQGYTITRLSVDVSGVIDPEEFRRSIRQDTILATIMLANNETGVIQPIEEVAAIAREAGILFHTDAAQAIGKIPVDVERLGVDMLSLAGHKLYAPKGIGVLYVRSGVELVRLIHGADHEQNRRAGTENTLQIAGLGEACRLAAATIDEEVAHQSALRDRLQEKLIESLPHASVNGHIKNRLPNTLSIAIPGIVAEELLKEISPEVAASAGAACHTGGVEISKVLKEMKIPLENAVGTLRLSTGRYTTPAEVDRAAEIIIAVAVKALMD